MTYFHTILPQLTSAGQPYRYTMYRALGMHVSTLKTTCQLSPELGLAISDKTFRLTGGEGSNESVSLILPS